MGIVHFYNLPVDQFIKMINANRLFYTEKYDGSNIVFGLDAAGRFYTARKNSQRYHSVDEWPQETWTNAFRSAHIFLNFWIKQYVTNKHLSSKNVEFAGEIINGKQPNVVKYSDSYKNSIVIFTAPKKFDIYKLYFYKNCCNYNHIHSKNGIDFVTEKKSVSYNVYYESTMQLGITSAFRKSCGYPEYENWLSKTATDGYTNYQLLTCNLTKVKQNRSEIKLLRAKARQQDTIYRKQISASFYELLNFDILTPAIAEGFVIQHGQIIAKIVNPEFGKANIYAHRVKYYLTGRNGRGGFLARTAKWCLQKRLDRLDYLLAKYNQHHRYMQRNFGKTKYKISVSYQGGELHQRTLCLFAETRRRLIDGR